MAYPKYRVWRAHSAFRSRQALLDYEEALWLAARLDDAMEVGAVLGGVMGATLV